MLPSVSCYKDPQMKFPGGLLPGPEKADNQSLVRTVLAGGHVVSQEQLVDPAHPSTAGGGRGGHTPEVSQEM